jgi:hypothetical protein
MHENGITTAPAGAAGPNGAARLGRLAALAEELGTNRIRDEAQEVAARIPEGRFYVACIG